ncbi:MAG: type II toxin-antitoxin system Phd/YefM family antitoxin [Nitrospirae bacterium]|nr:type II toxin-antitoxin system Phd/YefM family antitoxin [Nitrospirota bacterium]
MKTLPLSEVKAKLSELVDRVVSNNEKITITKNGRAVAVLVGLDEFESWKETFAIQSDRAFLSEIRKGVQLLKTKKVRRCTLDELFK